MNEQQFKEFLKTNGVCYVVRVHHVATKYNKCNDLYLILDQDFNKISLARDTDKITFYKNIRYGQYNKSLPSKKIVDVDELKREEC